jgi:catalase
VSTKKNPLAATADKVAETVRDAVGAANEIPGAPGPQAPAVEEPTEPRDPLPPKPDQSGPETVSPTGQATGTGQADVAQRGPYLTTAQGARL